MKTTLNQTLGWGSILALAGALTATALAGPGPQYWQQQQKLRAENAAKAQAAAPVVKAQPAAMACPSCQTKLVTEFSPTNVSGKWTASFVPVGAKHECAACGGAISRIRGKVTDDMKANCPICAKAKVDKVACCGI